jgi:hypothetical protein
VSTLPEAESSWFKLADRALESYLWKRASRLHFAMSSSVLFCEDTALRSHAVGYAARYEVHVITDVRRT